MFGNRLSEFFLVYFVPEGLFFRICDAKIS